VLGYVRLAVGAGERTVGLEDGGGVVELAVGRALEDGAADEDDLVLAGGGGEALRGRSGDGLGQVEGRAIVGPLAEVGPQEQLGQHDEVGAGFRGVGDATQGAVEVVARGAVAAHLDQGEPHGARRHGGLLGVRCRGVRAPLIITSAQSEAIRGGFCLLFECGDPSPLSLVSLPASPFSHRVMQSKRRRIAALEQEPEHSPVRCRAMAKAPDETLKHPILGVLKWDAERNHWLQQHETSPRGRLLDVQIEPGDRERRTLLKRAADLYLWALKNEPRVLRQAVEAYLLELYNDGWREEED